MTESRPRVSVVICTYNRAPDLDRALASIATQQSSEFNWEAIVVNNASTDGTEAVVEGWKDAFPLRSLKEPRPGLCRARNTGWQNALGDVVAYLDDDAIADPDWLTIMAGRFDEAESVLGCLGGRVDPIWEAPQPDWLSDQLALGLTILNWGDQPKAITDVRREWLVGTNIAFRRDALVAAGGFHPALDRAGSRMLSGGDVYLTRRLLELGFHCEYNPAMRVRHRVPADRLTQEWFRRRYFWQGVSDAVMELLDAKPTVPSRIRRAMGYGVRLASRPGDVFGALGKTADAVAFEKQCWTLIELGHFAGLMGVA